MKQNILKTFTVFILVILPFLIGALIAEHSPYVETNSFKNYLMIWTVVSIVIVFIVFLVIKYFKLERVGLFPFLLLCPIVGIIGLAAPPDLSITMLEHPEREHLRYTFLFLAALLFGAFAVFLIRSNVLKFNDTGRWMLAFLLTLAFVEFIWEFTHHYLYPEGLKNWIAEGKNAEDFGKNYDNFNIIQVGVIGRYIQFISIIWLALRFYKLRLTRIWSPLLVILLSLLGIISATVIYITQMNIPEGFEIIFLLFIPGMPFLSLYWLGAALLTNFKKNQINV